MFLKQFDIYGSSYTINTLGQEKYKTWFGCLSTLITVIIVGVATFLFGTDLLYKKNPKVINYVEILKESEPLFVNSANFTIAWRIEDYSGAPIAEENKYTFPSVGFFEYQRNSDGEFEQLQNIVIEPKKCSETRAKENPTILDLDLETYYCIDFEEIKQARDPSSEVPFYGNFDENYVANVYIQFNSCRVSIETDNYYDCVSFDEAVRRNNLGYQFISLILPRLNFKPSSFESPLNEYFENNYTKLSPYSETFQTTKFSNVRMENDVGWIFEDVQIIDAIEKTESNQVFGFLSEKAYDGSGSAYHFTFDTYLSRNKIVIKRSYMKIQELAANVGGILKAIMTFLSFFSSLNVKWSIHNEIVSLLFNLQGMPNKKGVGLNNKIRLDTSKVGELKPLRLGFCKFLAAKLCLRGDSKFKAEAERIKTILDIREILQTNIKVQVLSEKLLNHEREEEELLPSVEQKERKIDRKSKNEASVQDDLVKFKGKI